MNIKIRLRNVSFWYTLGAFIVTYIFAYYGITSADFTSWASVVDLIVDVANNPSVLLPLVIGIFGHFVDFTTPGISDSERVLSYKKIGGRD